jgi:hypothetical protein
MTTAEEMAEFLTLWSKVQEVQLTDAEDEIRWRWSANGRYSAKSAYFIQLRGSYCSFNSKAIWKAKVEGKHRFFAWLLVQQKILTADNLLIWNIRRDPVCALCAQELEEAAHLCLHCVFAREVWMLVAHWSENLVSVSRPGVGLEDWWNSSTNSLPKDRRARVSAIIIYTTWNLWKERNRRVFNNKSSTPSHVLALIKEEVQLRRLACAGGVPAT